MCAVTGCREILGNNYSVLITYGAHRWDPLDHRQYYRCGYRKRYGCGYENSCWGGVKLLSWIRKLTKIVNLCGAQFMSRLFRTHFGWCCMVENKPEVSLAILLLIIELALDCEESILPFDFVDISLS